MCIETTLTIATLTSYVSLVGSDIEYGVCIETTLTIATLTSYVSLVVNCLRLLTALQYKCLGFDILHTHSTSTKLLLRLA